MWVKEDDRERFKEYAQMNLYTVPELFQQIILMMDMGEIHINLNTKNRGE